MRLRLVVLGGFEARLVSGAALSVPTRKARALLAYLALRSGQPHPRDKLAALLWADSGDVQARTSLRQGLAILRRALAGVAPEPLIVHGANVALDPAAVDVDVAEFERALREGGPGSLDHAVQLYGGDLLEGLDAGAGPFEEWLTAERERLRELALEALARLLRHQVDAGLTEPGIRTALRLLSLDPLQEAAHRTLMRLYAHDGRRASALRQYQACVEVLQRELGVEPEPETRQVYRDVLRRQPAPAQPPAATPRMVARAEAPLVGRREEVARIGDALDIAAGRRGRTLVLLGEAGIGKSRLIEELAALGAQKGAPIFVGRCHETEQVLPFGPWVEILRAALSDVNLHAIGDVWRTELARLLPEAAEPGAAPYGPVDDHLRLFGAVVRVIELAAAASPVVLVVEDVHWADEMSVRLLGFIARRVRALPVLVAATARTEDLMDAPLLRRLLAELRTHADVTTIELGALTEAETLALIDVLGRTSIPANVRDAVGQQVWTLSRGNPFVAVETIRAAHEGQRFETVRLELPERVREAIAGRLERLGPLARDLVAAGAVIGREFDFSLARLAAGLEERHAAEGVEELVRRRVLHGVGERLDFTHDRIRAVAYAGLLPPRRALLHSAVARAIEQLHADRLDAHHAALGLHYRLGGVWDRALAHLRQAGAAAVACSANREAIACFEQAMDVVTRLPAGAARAEHEHDLTMYRAAVYYSLGEVRRIVDHLAHAEALARELGEPIRVARVAVLRLGTLAAMGRPAEAIEAGREGLAIADAARVVPLQASASVLLGFAHIGAGQFTEAIRFLRMTANQLAGQPEHRRLGQIGLPAVFWRAWIALPLGETGEFREAIALADEGARIADAAAQPYSAALALAALGHVHGLQGEPRLAIPPLERSVALCRDHEMAVLSPLAFGSLGHAYAACGRVREALDLIEEAIAQGDSLGIMWCQSLRTSRLGEGLLLAGRTDDARVAAERALALADAHAEPANRAYALRLRAEIARQPGNLPSAETDLVEAFRLAEELGMRPLAARCQLDLGRLYRGGGDRARAREHLAAAAARLRALDMRTWAEQAEEEEEECSR